MAVEFSPRHTTALWPKKTIFLMSSRRSKVNVFMRLKSSTELAFTDRRILAVNRKIADLRRAVFSNDPIRRYRQSNAARVTVGKDFLSSNSRIIAEDSKVRKELLHDRIEPPGNAFNLPNFGHQKYDCNWQAAPSKLEQKVS